MTERNVPKATLQRYLAYLKVLRRLRSSGVERTMPKELASIANIEPTTIRRDFPFLGNLGKQGYGYDVNRLIETFNQQLGMDFDEKIILIGAGNMGRVLMKYNKWDYVAGETACAFDVSPDRQGVCFDISVCDIVDLEKEVPDGCRIAILAISENIQQTVDRLIACGITGLVDFMHEHIQTPKGVVLRNVDVVSSVQELVFETNNLNVER